jgi:PDZ domain-containing protein
MQYLRTWYSRRNPWDRRLLQLVASLTAVAALLVFVPTPYYITAPGAAVDSSRMVNVEQGIAHPDRLYMLIVTSQPANLFWYLYAKLDRRAVLETPEEFLGIIEDYPQYVEWTRELMRDSQKIAQAVALQQIGYGRGVTPVSVGVTAVGPDSPARDLLAPGDLFVSVDGTPVASLAEMTDLLRQRPAGVVLPVRLLRDGLELSLDVPTMEHPDPERKGTAAFGINIAERLEYDMPIPISIRPGLITGPSAGLVFTLQIIDQLTPGGITGGLRVAATGTIEADGRVGRIGGVQQKVYAAETAGAHVMFVPQGDYAEASLVRTRMPVVPVDHVRDALEWLKANGGG